ncbi:MAG: hypothetical protein L0099_01560 [Acidobacteria bacterium]|nr:hypothetical protein [Acidobacteriota bacterium]
MRKQIRTTTRKLHTLEAQRTRLIQALIRSRPLLVGSVSLVKRTCGKPTCHCATRPGHPVWTLATTRDGRRRCQVIRIEDVEHVRQRVADYRSFKQRLGELEAIENDEKEVLRGLMKQRDLTYE